MKQSCVANELRAIFDGGTVAGLSDSQLLERFTSRRSEEAEPAFAALVARHGPMVFSVCQGSLGNTHDAEDAFQATFVVLARKAGSLWKPELLGPWLHGVASHSARRLKEKNTRRRRHEAEAAMSGKLPEAHAEQHARAIAQTDEIDILHQEIERLPGRYRTAIVLCDLEGLTHEEAARRLGRPVGTISARLSRARQRLRGRLSRRGLALPAGIIATAAGTSSARAMPAALVGSTTRIAMIASAGLTAGVVPASIASLSDGVLKSMLLARVKLISAAALFFGATATSVAVFAQQREQPQVAPAAVAARAPQPPAQPQTPTARPEEDSLPEAEHIVRSGGKLRSIARAIHAYLDANNLAFPSAAITSADGKPLLSWRVAILPYLGTKEKALHAEFKLDEPWDSPHNKALLSRMPKVYAPVVKTGDEKYETYYQGFVGTGALFENGQTVKVPDVTDGTVNTLMVVEAENRVPWTKPEDLPFEANKPLPKLGGQFKDGFAAATADGTPHFIKKTIDPTLLNALVTRNGGEVIDVATAGEGIQVP
jgi:RNA polymerase sigma factor (sigma-70 family)